VLHDPSASQEEKNKLAELRHSPRTRRKLTLAAARMGAGATTDPSSTNDYVQYGGLLHSSSSSSSSLPSPPIGEGTYARYSPPVESRGYTSLSSREYVPPKAVVSRTARMASRAGWDEYDRDAYRGHVGRETERRSNVLQVQGWEVDRSPPPPPPAPPQPALPGYASPRLLKRRREHEDDDRDEYEYEDDRFPTFQRRRPAAAFHFNVPSPAPSPSYAEIDAAKTVGNRLPSISSLNLPKIKEGSQTMLMRPVPDPGAQRVPSFAALLNAI